MSQIFLLRICIHKYSGISLRNGLSDDIPHMSSGEALCFTTLKYLPDFVVCMDQILRIPSQIFNGRQDMLDTYLRIGSIRGYEAQRVVIPFYSNKEGCTVLFNHGSIQPIQWFMFVGRNRIPLVSM